MVHLTTGSFDDGERFVEGDKEWSPGRSQSTPCDGYLGRATPLAPEAMGVLRFSSATLAIRRAFAARVPPAKHWTLPGISLQSCSGRAFNRMARLFCRGGE